MTGNGTASAAPPQIAAAAPRRRPHVRPRPVPQSESVGAGGAIATEGDRYYSNINNHNGTAAANGSPTATRHAQCGNAPQSPALQPRTMMTMGKGGNGGGNNHGGGGGSASPRSRPFGMAGNGADARGPPATGTSGRTHRWKRLLLGLSVASFVVVWVSVMTVMAAKLAGEDPSQQQERMADIPPTHRTRGVVDNDDTTIQEEEGEGGSIRLGQDTTGSSISIFGGIASMWRRMRCGKACPGRTYTYTDPISGELAMAPLQRMHRQVPFQEEDANGAGEGADRHYPPRGPVYYATPSMLPYYPPPPSSSPRRSTLQTQWDRQGALDPMLRVRPGEEAAPQDHDRQPYVQGDCVPMKPWQASSFPNCNAFHELNMMGAGRDGTDVAFRHGGRRRHHPRRMGAGGSDGGMYHVEEDSVHFLGRGWFRAAWKVDFGLEGSYPVVLKTLRLEREFYDEYYDLHRKDAVAMERLTPSPYVIDIYGFCGQSAINELADFFEDFTNLQAFARQLGGNNDEHLLRLKLQICIMMALGVAHMHEIDGPNNATMVHYDINPKNVAIVKGGKPKLNDFNTVEFIRWNRVKQRRCGFRGRLHEPWWRAPEELIMPAEYAEGKNISSDAIVATFEDQPLIDEKIDVWSLGNLIYNMLTGHAARGQARSWRYAEVRRDVLAAKMPWRPTDAMYLNSSQPAIVAMRRAVERCIVKDPRKRWSALDVAYEMMDALDKILEENENSQKEEGEQIKTNKKEDATGVDERARARHKRVPMR